MRGKISTFSVKDRSLSQTKYVKHVRRRVTLFTVNKAKGEIIKTNTSVVILSGGGLVLPYFKDSCGRWNIVLVSQFRPAVTAVTVEAPGGRLDSETSDVALARELFEEAGIKVKPQSITIVVNEYTHPSILSTLNIGGIVRIKPNMVKNKKIAGNSHENEWTQVEIFDLVEIMKKRDAKLIMLDLMTSRLIDEVAKATKMLIKNY